MFLQYFYCQHKYQQPQDQDIDTIKHQGIQKHEKTETTNKKSTLTIKDVNHIQYIYKNITEIFLSAENKLRNKKDKYQWLLSFGRTHALVTYWCI